ncbi:hypothetical protein B7494_g3445 [Chlorociboria aeruginascens]|nr:hypothetical protein B7494_g3445 [Chlorociboria aeruginascens]
MNTPSKGLQPGERLPTPEINPNLPHRVPFVAVGISRGCDLRVYTNGYFEFSGAGFFDDGVTDDMWREHEHNMFQFGLKGHVDIDVEPGKKVRVFRDRSMLPVFPESKNPTMSKHGTNWERKQHKKCLAELNRHADEKLMGSRREWKEAEKSISEEEEKILDNMKVYINI